MTNFNIIQWNIKGFTNNYIDLQLILNDHHPHFISLQETHIPHNSHLIAPNSYTAYSANHLTNTQSKGGIAILIKSHIPHEQIFNSSKLLNIAIEVTLNIKVTIVSL